MIKNLSVALATLLLASVSSALAAPKHSVPRQQPAVLAQSTNGPYTLRVLKAKWAPLNEVSSWRSTDQALTLWVDVVSQRPFIPTPQEITDHRISLVSRLVDARLKGNEFDSQLVSVGVDHYYRDCPYVPGESPKGQIIWRVQNLDPRSKEVLLAFEFLVPGSSPLKADWPSGLLTKENAALRVTKNDKAETRRFSIRLPLNHVEPFKPQVRQVGTPKSVTSDARTWKVWSVAVATPEPDAEKPEFWTGVMPVVVSGEASPGSWKFDLLDESGREWPLDNAVRYDQTAYKYWGPDGRIIAPNERSFELTAQIPVQLSPQKPWTLRGTRESQREQIAEGDFKAVTIPATSAPGAPGAAPPRIGQWSVRETRRFSPENPLSKDWAPASRKSGIALKLALSVPQQDVWAEGTLRNVTTDSGQSILGNDRKLMVIGRENVAGNFAVIFQAVLPDTENLASTLNLKVYGGLDLSKAPHFTINGLSFPIAQPKSGK